ncbi:MAG: hypothetical protein RR784_08290 [Burkholderiaceae bacterium]
MGKAEKETEFYPGCIFASKTLGFTHRFTQFLMCFDMVVALGCGQAATWKIRGGLRLFHVCGKLSSASSRL